MICHIHFRHVLHFVILTCQVLWASENILTNIDTAQHAMVVASRSEAVEAGLEMLHSGGNAIDAAVAAAFVLGVVEPYASGLGGGGGMLVYLASRNEFSYIDYYVQAPARIDTNFVSSRDRGTARSICVPGTPSGLLTALKKYGTLTPERVLKPAIMAARAGFLVNEVFFNAVLEKLELILKYPATSEVFLNEHLPYMTGDTLTLPALALVLEGLIEQGDAYFYRGNVKHKMVEAIRQGGGLIMENDFHNYLPIISVPLSTEFRDYQIYSASPPQSGVTLLEILNLVELIEGDFWRSFEKSDDAIHWMCQAIKRADADRYAYLADPRFSKVPVLGLLNENYTKIRFSEIIADQKIPVQQQKIEAGDPWPYEKAQNCAEPVEDHEIEGPHTTQISVIDEQGNAVSLTQTLGFFFGSGLSVDGILLNSGMTNFSRYGVNKMEANKRPRSTIAPTIIMKDNRPFAVLGTPGGGTIFNTMAQVIIRLLDFENTPQEAVDAPRFSTRVTAEQLTIENRFSTEVVKNLEKRGYLLKHNVPYDVYMGGVQLILFDQKNQFYIGVSDPRRNGVAQGY
jgi:gamma-glutamyltranspeptidase/glutathione hydrolase